MDNHEKIKRYTINHVSQIIPVIKSLLKDNKRSVMAVDWDNCISKYNGCQLPLREGKDTLAFFNQINRLHIPWFVITARMAGKHPNELITSDTDHGHVCVMRLVDDMINNFPPLKKSTETGLIMTPNIVTVRHIFGNNAGYSIVHRGIIFAGGRDVNFNKGKALINYMALGYIAPATGWDYFIFVDNDLSNVQHVENAFKANGLGDRLITFHYPQTPLLEGKCENAFSLQNCINNT